MTLLEIVYKELGNIAPENAQKIIDMLTELKISKVFQADRKDMKELFDAFMTSPLDAFVLTAFRAPPELGPLREALFKVVYRYKTKFVAQKIGTFVLLSFTTEGFHKAALEALEHMILRAKYLPVVPAAPVIVTTPRSLSEIVQEVMSVSFDTIIKPFPNDVNEAAKKMIRNNRGFLFIWCVSVYQYATCDKPACTFSHCADDIMKHVIKVSKRKYGYIFCSGACSKEGKRCSKLHSEDYARWEYAFHKKIATVDDFFDHYRL